MTDVNNKKKIEDINEVQEQTEYCLNCKVPQCQKGCPLENDIPTFINFAKKGEYEKAYEILCNTTVLPAICGRICPHQKQCMGKCVKGIKGESVNIGKIEAFIADKALKNENSLVNSFQANKGKCKEQGQSFVATNNKTKKVAIVGSGPSGLTCAAFLRKAGIDVTIYEKYNSLGGILRRGIPEFRLDKSILDKTIAQILNLGIKVEYNKELGRNLKLKDLQEKYDAIYLAIGANISVKMGIEGEDLEGVFGANTLLEKGNHLNYTGKRVVVIGGGNVAMDTARTINKIGAKSVQIIYRRAEEQMPAERKEIEDAKKEGIEFLFQTNIAKIIGKNKIEKIECVKMDLVQKEGETRLVPIEIQGSNYKIPVDYVIMATGARTDTKILIKEGIELTDKKYVKVDDTNKTSQEKIFAGGDLIGTNATVAYAARDGRNASKKICEFLEQKII